MAPLPSPRGASSTLLLGAETMLGKTTASSRAAEKFGMTSARPPPIPRYETMPAAGKSTSQRDGDLITTLALGEEAFSLGAISQRRVYGNHSSAPLPEQDLERTVNPAALHAGRQDIVLDDELDKFLRNFVSRARGAAPHRRARLEILLRQAASQGRPGDEQLTKEDFTKISIAEGLCRFFHECDRLFLHFASQGVSSTTVAVNALVRLVRGNLPPHRATIVKEVWDQLDLHQRGSITVGELLQNYDLQRVPDVRFGREDFEGASRKFLEGLGVSQSVLLDRCAEFTLEESAARRRGRPVGDPRGGGPVSAPAGTTCQLSRLRGDAPRELAARTPAHDVNALVSWEGWEAHFTSVSVGIREDETFEKILREPLMTYKVYGRAQAERLVTAPGSNKTKRCEIRLLGHFEDGSRRVLSLPDDDGLESLEKRAGTSDGMFWNSGPKVHDEILRRLQAAGHSGLQRVQMKPF
eukprot:TRINITY_DN14917_c0_g1_i1.p1 TRINITY_DN14917_c0_g1~~TRINITY_DN14917_c0_g1_i1.p1  ORF type:complete len:468 (+),score=63.21 TRINITY_DN14917_c0_g1_i1:161-1564(+)